MQTPRPAMLHAQASSMRAAGSTLDAHICLQTPPDPRQDGGRRDDRRGTSPGSPPDLDELWRDFNRKLNDLFRRRGGGLGGPRGPRRSGFKPSGPLAGMAASVVAVLFVLTWLGSGFFVVQDGEQGVVTQLGRIVGLEDPGLHWHLPGPFGGVQIVDVGQSRVVDLGIGASDGDGGMGPGELVTADGDIVDVRYSVRYRIIDARAYVLAGNDPDALVRNAGRVAVREIVGARTVGALLGTGHATLADQTQQRIQALLDPVKAGIDVTGVTVKQVQPPAATRSAFAALSAARQVSDQWIADARGHAGEVVTSARGTASAMLLKAEAYRTRVVAEATGDADRFNKVLTQYRKAPEVTRESMYLQAMQDMLSKVTKVVVDTHGSGTVINLPLDKLLAADGASQASSSLQEGVPASLRPPVSAPLSLTAPQASTSGSMPAASSAGGAGTALARPSAAASLSTSAPLPPTNPASAGDPRVLSRNRDAR